MYFATANIPEHRLSLLSFITGGDAAKLDDWFRDTSNTPNQLELSSIPTLKFDCADINHATQAVFIKSNLMIIRSSSDPFGYGMLPAGAPQLPLIQTRTLLLAHLNLDFYVEAFGPNGYPILFQRGPIRAPDELGTRVLLANIIRLPTVQLNLGPPSFGPPFPPHNQAGPSGPQIAMGRRGSQPTMQDYMMPQPCPATRRRSVPQSDNDDRAADSDDTPARRRSADEENNERRTSKKGKK